MKYLLALATLFSALIQCHAIDAKLKAAGIFHNGMVLQRQMPVPVWGWTSPGTKVNLTFAGKGYNATADAKGKWMIKLPAMEASSKGQTMTVQAGEERLTFQDILVGEVWLCGGQSNMEQTMRMFAAKSKDKGYESISSYIGEEIKTANDPLLRQFEVQRSVWALGPREDLKGTWSTCNPKANRNFTATGYFFGRELRRELGVPVGLIKSCVGGTRIEPWMPASAFAGDKSMQSYYTSSQDKIKKAMKSYDPAKAKQEYAAAKKKFEEDCKAGRKARRPRMRQSPAASGSHNPTTYYNAMIAPLVPYAIRGVIWYQGESNTKHHAREYEQYFSALIASWRKKWGQGDFPFYYAQLASFWKPVENPQETGGWVLVQDNQRRCLALPNTGMAVLNDIGQQQDIHPRNKPDAGRRLSLLALKKTYGQDLPVCMGPLYKSHRIDGSKIIITFDSVGSGLMVGKKTLMEPTVQVKDDLAFFQICGSDGKWLVARARITGKNQVEVSHPDMKTPTAVRYAWDGNPVGANLYNKEGLPASCFTTEKKK